MPVDVRAQSVARHEVLAREQADGAEIEAAPERAIAGHRPQRRSDDGAQQQMDHANGQVCQHPRELFIRRRPFGLRGSRRRQHDAPGALGKPLQERLRDHAAERAAEDVGRVDGLAIEDVAKTVEEGRERIDRRVSDRDELVRAGKKRAEREVGVAVADRARQQQQPLGAVTGDAIPPLDAAILQPADRRGSVKRLERLSSCHPRIIGRRCRLPWEEFEPAGYSDRATIGSMRIARRAGRAHAAMATAARIAVTAISTSGSAALTPNS